MARTAETIKMEEYSVVHELKRGRARSEEHECLAFAMG